MAEVYKTNLSVGTPDFIGRSESLINLHHGSIHGSLLDNLASNVDIILCQQ